MSPWEEYLEIVHSIYSADEWNNADDDVRQEYSGRVVKKLIKSWDDNKISKFMPELYNARHVREWEMLKNLDY